MKENIMKRLIVLAVLVFPKLMTAQDIHFSQMGYSPLTLNPALAGANYDLQVNVNYRNQWNSVAVPFQTIGASVDTRLNARKKTNKKAHVAMGINFFNDMAGEARITTNNANLHIATHVMVGDGHTLGAGLYGGWGQRSIDPSAGKWASQYNGLNHDPMLSSGETFNSPTFSMFDTGAGLLYTYNSGETRIAQNDSKIINAGFAAYHLNRPNFSFLNRPEERMYIRFSGFVNGSFGVPNTHLILEPGVYYHQQGKAREVLLGMYARYIIKDESRITSFVKKTTVALGLFYRNQDALIAKAHVEWRGFGIGVAYDFNLFSDLMKVSRSRGGLELALRWVVPDLYLRSHRIH